MKKEYIIAIIIGLIPVIATIIWNKYETDKIRMEACKPKCLDMRKYISYQSVEKEELEEKKIAFLYEGKPLNSFTRITIEIFNFSDSKYDNLDLYIEFLPEDGDSLKTVDAEVYGIGKLPEAITFHDDDLVHTTKNSLKFHYTIISATKADSVSQAIFTGSYLISGNKEPKIKVDSPGYLLQEYDTSHFYKPSMWDNPYFIISCIIVFFIFYILFLRWFFSRGNEEKDRVLKKRMIKELNKKIRNSKIEYTAESITNVYSKLTKVNEWKTTSGFSHWINKMKKPAIEDLDDWDKE